MKFLKAILLTLAAALILGALPAQAADNSLRPELRITRAKSDQCVEPTEIMRAKHMDFLLHQRDATMHEGIRTTKHSLKECIECHANKDEQGKYIPVNAPGEFCHSCHDFTAVSMDCFQCHATKPRDAARTVSNMNPTGSAK